MRRGPGLVLVLSLVSSLAPGSASRLAAEERFVSPLPPAEAVEVRSGLSYAGAGGAALGFDLYLPARRSGPVPVVVFLNGIGAPWLRGHVQYTSWGRAVTARGLAGVTMDSREGSIDADFAALVEHLRAHATELGIDPSRLALWSCSSNAQRGLPLGLGSAAVRAAVVYYGSGEVASFPVDRPLLLVRAGLDNAGLNRAIDGLAARALADNAPVELLNVAGGVHGFDLRDDDDASRAAIARTLDFLERSLAGGATEAVAAGAEKAAAAAAVYGGRWAEAVAAYERLAAAGPSDPIAWQKLGEAKRETGDRAGALAAFERALALETPNRGIVSFAVATLHAEAGDDERALAALTAMKPWLRFFRVPLTTSPAFARLRADPRFVELLAGVPPPG